MSLQLARQTYADMMNGAAELFAGQDIEETPGLTGSVESAMDDELLDKVLGAQNLPMSQLTPDTTNIQFVRESAVADRPTR